MMRRFVKTVSALLAGCAALVSLSAAANAQEIQLTGPLAGAPAVRQLRLHRAGRFDIALGSSFTLLDEYLHNVMPSATLTYHFTDWLGLGVFGGYAFQYNTGLATELQQVIQGYNCAAQPFTQPCRLTAVNLTKGNIVTGQLGHINWMAAPQLVAVPFRGKVSLFSVIFLDADVDIFAGAAFTGIQERADCGQSDSGATLTPCSAASTFTLASRVAIAPTFGAGLNFYPSSNGTNFFGVGFEFRAYPFSWNDSGFDVHGGGNNGNFPDNNVNSHDREFHFNTMGTIQLKFTLPPGIQTNK